MPRAKTAANGVLYYEAGQDYQEMTELTDSGDQTTFQSDDSFWSDADGYEPTVRPNGLVSGGTVSVADSGSNDVVDIAALTCYLAGTLTSVSASTDFDISRGTGDGYKVCSITVTSAGALAEVEGTEGTEFSETRDANGGPPLIPVGSIEIAQVRLDSTSAAAITASEIKQVVGTHCERYDYPLWDIDYTNGEVAFLAALSAIHTGSAAKKVYAEYYTPTWSEVPSAYDFVPPENTHSVSSEQVYGGTVGSSSKSLGQGSFSCKLQTGVDDNILAAQDDTRWFKFLPNRSVTGKYVACQGVVGISRQFPAGTSIQADCTISASEAATNITS
jgi:hypothetical protein